MSWRSIYRIIAAHAAGSYTAFAVAFLLGRLWEADLHLANWAALVGAPVVVPFIGCVVTTYGIASGSFEDLTLLAKLFSIYIGASVIAYNLIGRKRRIQVGRVSAGLCAWCGYDLRGSQGNCPECGGERLDYLRFDND